jgi:hypothetical protein
MWNYTEFRVAEFRVAEFRVAEFRVAEFRNIIVHATLNFSIRHTKMLDFEFFKKFLPFF